MPIVPGLRSPYAKVGRIVYFGRMLDKIRLQTAGKLPEDYLANLGDSKPGVFDTRCCQFLRVPYAQIKTWTLANPDDAAVLQLAEAAGGPRADDECAIWNGFMIKRGWHDAAASVATLRRRIAESALEGKGIETFFDYIDFDEGRNSISSREWEKI